MLYKEQLQIKESSKQNIVANITKEELNNFYSPCNSTKSAKVQMQNHQNKSDEKNRLSALDKSLVYNNLLSLQKKLISKNIQALPALKLLTEIGFGSMLAKNNIVFKKDVKIGTETFNYKVNNYLFNLVSTEIPTAKNSLQEKSEIAKQNGFRCIHVFDWDNVQKIINNLLLPKESIMARKCSLEIINKQTAVNFIEINHLQGYARDSIRLGLFYNKELVSVMTFGKPRYNKNYQYELIRYCSAKKIIGGGEKLFKNFIKLYNPTSVISYCDTSKFIGNIYKKLGFQLLRKPQPSKHWYNIKTKEHYLDSLVRQQGFSRIVHHCDASKDTLTTSDNHELMINAGFVEIYDCGQSSWVWTNEAN